MRAPDDGRALECGRDLDESADSRLGRKLDPPELDDPPERGREAELECVRELGPDE